MPVAVLYSPANRDPFYHARIGCTHGKIRIRDNGNYRVNREEYARHKGKFPCPECWLPGGYIVERKKAKS